MHLFLLCRTIVKIIACRGRPRRDLLDAQRRRVVSHLAESARPAAAPDPSCRELRKMSTPVCAAATSLLRPACASTTTRPQTPAVLHPGKPPSTPARHE